MISNYSSHRKICCWFFGVRKRSSLLTSEIRWTSAGAQRRPCWGIPIYSRVITQSISQVHCGGVRSSSVILDCSVESSYSRVEMDYNCFDIMFHNISSPNIVQQLSGKFVIFTSILWNLETVSVHGTVMCSEYWIKYSMWIIVHSEHFLSQVWEILEQLRSLWEVWAR